jgi:UDP-3-O-[3-hydroxymyristoyl] glucosamine N-acyltransferase
MTVAFTIRDILGWSGGRLANGEALGALSESIRVCRPGQLGTSTPDEIAFFFSKEYQNEVPTARAGILITGEPFVAPLQAARPPWWPSTAVIACADPYLAMAILSEKFAESLSTAGPRPCVPPGVHPSSVIHPTAEIGPGVSIGPFTEVQAGARIGARSVIGSNCSIGPGAMIGEDTRLFASVVVYESVRIGSRVRIHSNTTLGSDGFGYAPRTGPDGKPTGHQKIWHLGRVLVGDDAEIGANCSIDRGTFGDTVVGRGAKLDNQVHLGHNSRVDEGGIVCGGTCLAGGASVGAWAYVGGLTGITNRVHVGEGAKVAALALISKDVPPGETAVGNPQRSHSDHFKAHALLNRMLKKKE